MGFLKTIEKLLSVLMCIERDYTIINNLPPERVSLHLRL